MATFETRLKHRERVAEDTMAFHFERPQEFQFKPGQAMRVTLISPPETDAKGNARTFSIVGAPFEEGLVVATRMRETAFKRVLRTLPLGTGVKLTGPFGSFTLHEDVTRPAVFLAGGIGVTPFVSILRQAARDKLPHRLFLFYSNRRPEDAAFLDELQQLQKKNPNYKCIATMVEMEKSQRPWTGETDFIRREMLVKSLPEMIAPLYYTAGPPAMVAAMRAMLNEAGVGSDNIRTEEFPGY